MTKRFENKVALLTGSASAYNGERMGFGGAAAWKILEEGGKVVITDIQDDKGRTAAEQMRSQGYEALYKRLDVLNEENWSSVVAKTVDTFGSLDILVNLAGAQDSGTLYEVDVEQWRRVMEISTTGILLGTRAVIPAMEKQAEEQSSTCPPWQASSQANTAPHTQCRAPESYTSHAHPPFNSQSSESEQTQSCPDGSTHPSPNTSTKSIPNANGDPNASR